MRCQAQKICIYIAVSISKDLRTIHCISRRTSQIKKHLQLISLNVKSHFDAQMLFQRVRVVSRPASPWSRRSRRAPQRARGLPRTVGASWRPPRTSGQPPQPGFYK